MRQDAQVTRPVIKLVLLCLLVSGCGYNESTFNIVNKSIDTAHRVSVSDGSKTWQMGDLDSDNLPDLRKS